MMRIRAYIRLQSCSTSDRKAFVHRRRAEHGIARGAIGWYAVEGSSWGHIRRVLKTFDVMGFSVPGPESVQGYAKDTGEGAGRLTKLHPHEVPESVGFDAVKDRESAPELTSFGAVAVERT